MAVIIKNLAIGRLPEPVDPPQTIEPIYTAPSTTTPMRAAIVKSIQLVNTDSSEKTINLRVKAKNSTGSYIERAVAPVDMKLAAGYLAVADEEITLSPGDSIYGTASAENTVDFVINGVEREVI